MDGVEAFVQIAVAGIGAVGGAYAPIAVAKLNVRKSRSQADQGGKKMAAGKKYFWSSAPFAFLVAPGCGMLIALALFHGGRALAQSSATIQAPTSVEGYYYASGWMGDGEKGTKHLQVNDQWTSNPHSTPTCIRISYQPGPAGWAGVYWQYPNGNWGAKPGRKIIGATKVSFWARGEKGKELVAFKAGGINTEGRKYRDSFEKSLGPVKLSKEWQPFEIPLGRADTTSVIGAFSWSASQKGNPSGLVFFVDDIRYE
jgi:hypothetical protein